MFKIYTFFKIPFFNGMRSSQGISMEFQRELVKFVYNHYNLTWPNLLWILNLYCTKSKVFNCNSVMRLKVRMHYCTKLFDWEVIEFEINSISWKYHLTIFTKKRLSVPKFVGNTTYQPLQKSIWAYLNLLEIPPNNLCKKAFERT